MAVWLVPELALAANASRSAANYNAGLGFDATFRAFVRSGATIAPALIGPPPRATPRRMPSEPSEPSEPGDGDAAPTEPAPSDSSAEADATPPPAGATPSGAPPAAGGTKFIPRPNAVPMPDQAAAALEGVPEEDATSSGPSRAQMERALPTESGPPPSKEAEVQVETGPARLIRGKSVPPFWIDRTWTTHRTRALTLPPLFFHRSGGANNPEKLAHFDLSLTMGWYSKRVQKRRYLAPLALFFGSFSERTSAWAAAVLLMGYKRTGEQYNFGQFPFVWRWGNKQVKNLVVVPFHYHQKTPDSLRGFDAILFWYGHKNTTDSDPLNDLRYFVGAPLFLQLTRGVTRTTVGLPLYVGGTDKAKGIKHRTVFPFAHWQTREFGNRKELWTLLYLQRSDEARKRKTWAVPPLLTFSRDTPERSLLSVTPLVWRSENKVKGSTAWAAFPWVSYRDPEQRNRVLFPLYWQFDDLRTGARAAFVFPLGGGTRRPGGAWGMVLPPLLTVARHDPKGRSFQVVTPLFWRFRDRTAFGGQGSQQVVVPPLFVYNQQGPRRDAGVIPLLSFFGRDATRRYQVIAPLLFGHVLETDRNKWHDTWVFGPVYAKRTVPGWHAGVLPVAAMGRDDTLRYTVIPPLLFGDVTYVKEQRRLTLSPIFARSKSPDSRTIGVLNLFWDVKRKGDERHTVMFPLVYRRQHADRVLTVTPLGGGWQTKDRRTWMATPLLYGARDLSGPPQQRRGSFGLIPLVFWDRRPADGGMARNLVVAPLFAFHRAPAEDLDMWSPLVWRTATRGEKPRKNLAVVPLYFRQRQPGGVDVDAGIAPLPFFHSRDKVRHTHTLIAGPFFHRLSRTALNTGVAPVTWWMDSEKSRRLISLPIIFHQKNKQSGEHTTIAVPFWFDRRRANGRRAWVALPFVVGVKGQHNFTRFSLIPPGFVDIHRLAKNYRFTGYAPLLFRHQKCGFREEDDDRCRYTLWGSFPLFLAGRDGLGRRTHSALALYYFDRDRGGTRFFTLLGGANVRPKEKLTWYALNVGRSVTRTHATTVVFPLFFRKAHRSEDRSTTVVLPPLFVGRRKEESRWFEAALVFWNFRQPHKVTTAIVPPIFYTSHAYAEKRMTWTIPLFLRSNNWAKDSSATIVPPALFVQRRKGEDQSFVQFPLLWHIERGEDAGTVGAAVWWDIRRKKTRTQVVPALFARHVNRKGEATTVIGPGLGWWKRKSNKVKALHWRALFGFIGGGNEGGKRYFSLLGGKIKLKPKPVWESKRALLRAEKKKRAAEAKAAEKARAEQATPRPAAPGSSITPVSKPATPAASPAKAPATAPATSPASTSPPENPPASTPPASSPWSGAAPGGRPGVNTSSPPPAPSGTTTPTSTPPGR